MMNAEVLSRPNLVRRVFPSLAGPATSLENDQYPLAPSLLSSHEVEILEYIAVGNSNKQNAKLLGISDQAVKHHITLIQRKLTRQRAHRSNRLRHQTVLNHDRIDAACKRWARSLRRSRRGWKKDSKKFFDCVEC
jgi:DNA-binding NarL/FixJ family response regulator